MSILQRLKKSSIPKLSPPFFIWDNTHYEVIMGSFAYGVTSDTSDVDVYGFCIPPKDWIFPHLRGEIPGFGTAEKRFEQFQQHHIKENGTEKTYDLSIYSIVKYFNLCMENNPNMIDSLFVPFNCIVHSTHVGNRVREKRRIFLHKGIWHKLKGYAYSQIHKMQSKEAVGKRKEVVEKFGYDVKFAYHCVRLLNQGEQVLMEGDLDLQRSREQLKSIRRGEWKIEEIIDYFNRKEKEMEKLYIESNLPHSPDENAIKTLLLECLEEHYGTLENCIITEDKAVSALKKIRDIVTEIV